MVSRLAMKSELFQSRSLDKSSLCRVGNQFVRHLYSLLAVIRTINRKIDNKVV